MPEATLPKLPEPDWREYDGVFDGDGGKLVDKFSRAQLIAAMAQAAREQRDRDAALMRDMDCAHRCGVGAELSAAILAQTVPGEPQ